MTDKLTGPRSKVSIATLEAALISSIEADRQGTKLARCGQDAGHLQWAKDLPLITRTEYGQMWPQHKEALQQAARTNLCPKPDNTGSNVASERIALSFTKDISEIREEYKLTVPASTAAKGLNAILHTTTDSEKKEFDCEIHMTAEGFQKLQQLTENGSAEVTTSRFLQVSSTYDAVEAMVDSDQLVKFKVIGYASLLELEGQEPVRMFPYGMNAKVEPSQDAKYDFVLTQIKGSSADKDLLPD